MSAKHPRKLSTKSARVKAIARERVGSPKPTRALEEGSGRSKPKYKRSWREELAENG